MTATDVRPPTRIFAGVFWLSAVGLPVALLAVGAPQRSLDAALGTLPIVVLALARRLLARPRATAERPPANRAVRRLSNLGRRSWFAPSAFGVVWLPVALATHQAEMVIGLVAYVVADINLHLEGERPTGGPSAGAVLARAGMLIGLAGMAFVALPSSIPAVVAGLALLVATFMSVDPLRLTKTREDDRTVAHQDDATA